MRVLFITQWYPPVKGGASKRAERLANYFISRNHKLTVLTGFPSYPTGILDKKYHRKLWTKEKQGKINILRTYEYPAPINGTLKRLLNWISFMVSASIAIFFLPKFDAVIVTCPSFLSGIPGLLAKKIAKCDFYYDVSDLWPDSAIDLGLLSQKPLIKLAEGLEKSYYRNAKKIFTAHPWMVRHLVKEGVDAKNISLCLNSADMDLFKPKKIDRKKFGYQKDDFIVLYTGNHSRVYDLENVIKTAEKLKKTQKIKFLFIGEGESKENLIKLAKKLNLKNIQFQDEKELNELSEFINLADICLIPIAAINISQNTIPSKTAEYLGCGKPVIAAISGDLLDMINKEEIGLNYKSGNLKELTGAILKLYKETGLRKKMALNAHRLALKTFSTHSLHAELDKTFSH